MRRANLRFNYNDYLQLPEDKRYEILDGDLCMVPSPNTRHQTVLLKLAAALYNYVNGKKLGRVFTAPFDVVLSQENIVQPDILFVRKERAGVVGELNLRGAPDIVIEILSEGTRRRDLDIKQKIYGRFGVPEYWIVDPDASTVEVLIWTEQGYRAAGLYSESDRLSSPLLTGIDLALSDIFLNC